MNAARLSICIPVHNFGAFLPATLDSILAEASDEVEIVVVDGASTDETPEIARRYRARFPRFQYHRLPVKGGIDRDLARAVEFATGEYCWLFSGDDLMRPGAIPRVLGELSLGCDVYVLDSMLCRLDMTPIVRHGILDASAPTTFRLHETTERLEYFRRARNTAAFFSFCSSLVIKKARWDAASIDDSWFGTCWAHAARIVSMIPSGLVVRYLPEPLLDKRGENDSFLTDGLTRRLALAVDGYHRIADTFFGHDSEEALHIRRSVRQEQPLSLWSVAKIELPRGRADQVKEFRRVVRKLYSDATADAWKGPALLATPTAALRAARFVMTHGRRLVARSRGE